MTDPERPEGERDRRKAVLFCPACEYESPIEGEWVVRSAHAADGDRREVLLCPECETRLPSTRPAAIRSG